MSSDENKASKKKVPSIPKEEIKEKLKEWLKTNKPKSCQKGKAQGTRSDGMGCYAPFGASGVMRATSLSKEEYFKEQADKKNRRVLRAKNRQRINAIKGELQRRSELSSKPKKRKKNKSVWVSDKVYKEKLKYYGVDDLRERLAFLLAEEPEPTPAIPAPTPEPSPIEKQRAEFAKQLKAKSRIARRAVRKS